MDEKNIITIKTTKGELRYYRDWENWEGGVRMLNAQTVKRYREIQDEHPDADKYAVFFAFSKEQFEEGYNGLVEKGFIKNGDKVLQSAGGMFGTKEGINAFLGYYEERDKKIPLECDPQEVYFYEYNNHESMLAWDGDLEAIKLVIDYWGADVARKIKRYNANMSVENIIRKPIKTEGLYFVHDGEKRTPASLWFSNVESELAKAGNCYTMYDNALHLVFTPNGEAYSNIDLKGVGARYDGKTIYDFFVE